MNDSIFVSIIVPCRNEERFIGRCLDSIMANDYPKDRLEVLVVDGNSGDATRKIVREYAQKYQCIKLLDNPRRITPCALNIGAKNAKGQMVIRMDAHATYEQDHISKSITYMEEFNADAVGGVIRTVPRNDGFIGKSICIALSHRFGVGNSAHKTGTSAPKWVDTAFGICYRKQVFEKVGLFNESLPNTQDMEFNLRLRKSGGQILLAPDIVSYYYARSDFRSFCANNFRNGIWATYPFRFTTIMPVSWRHLVPLAFVMSLIGTAALSLLSRIFGWAFLAIVGAYALLNVCSSVGIARRERDHRLLFVMPIIFAALHICYGLGSIWGAIKLLGKRPS